MIQRPDMLWLDRRRNMFDAELQDAVTHMKTHLERVD